jgi:Glycosyl transferases group 1
MFVGCSGIKNCNRSVQERGCGEVITRADLMTESGATNPTLASLKPVAWIVEEQHNPSTDHYVEPALRRLGFEVVRCGLMEVPPPSELRGTAVVFVRYVSPAWRKAVDAVRGELSGLVYFMDDDLLDLHATVELSARYRLKLWRMAARHYNWLLRQKVAFWVSTDVLARKYAALAPKVVSPSPLPAVPHLKRIFYHGSESHRAEIEWLVPVIGAVLANAPDAGFEVIGDSEVRKLFVGIPRVTVIHPLKWPAYLGFSAGGERHIGLAPLLDTRFNRSRSHTRFLDHTRMGAAGVYSESSANAAVVTPGHDGVVVPMRPNAWVEAILELLADEALRSSIAANAKTTVARLAEVATVGFPALMGDLTVRSDPQVPR